MISKSVNPDRIYIDTSVLGNYQRLFFSIWTIRSSMTAGTSTIAGERLVSVLSPNSLGSIQLWHSRLLTKRGSGTGPIPSGIVRVDLISAQLVARLLGCLSLRSE